MKTQVSINQSKHVYVALYATNKSRGKASEMAVTLDDCIE